MFSLIEEVPSFVGRSGEIRTPDPLLPKQVPAHAKVADSNCGNQDGCEPATIDAAKLPSARADLVGRMASHLDMGRP
jgi:hypothetical protein